MKKLRYLVIILVISLVLVFGISYSFREQIKSISNSGITISYDNTWKIKKQNSGINLIHKKTGSELNFQIKLLDDSLMDIKLSEIITDIIDSVEKQNNEYLLINKEYRENDNYESYSYLYEKDMEQVLVNVYKSDKRLVIVYYEANSEYYDIVLDSVDTILDSMKIEKGN